MPIFQFGLIIRSRREELGYTQEDLADGICSVPTLSRIENGERMPTREHFEMLVQRLGYSDTMLDAYVDDKQFYLHDLKFKIRQAIILNKLNDANIMIVEYKRNVPNPTQIERQFIILCETLANSSQYSPKERLTNFEEAIQLLKLKRFDGYGTAGDVVPDPGTTMLAMALTLDDELTESEETATAASAETTEVSEVTEGTDTTAETEESQVESALSTTEATEETVSAEETVDESVASVNAEADNETETVATITETEAKTEEISAENEPVTEATAEVSVEQVEEATNEADTEAAGAVTDAGDDAEAVSEDAGTYTVLRTSSGDETDILPNTHNFIRWEGRYVEYQKEVDAYGLEIDTESEEMEPISEGDTKVLTPGYYVLVFKYESVDNTYENDLQLREYARFMVIRVIEGSADYPEVAASKEDGYSCIILDPVCGYTTMIRQLAGDPVELASGSLLYGSGNRW